MNLPIDREVLSQCVIVLGVCLGGWMFLVKPGAEELRELENQIAERRAKIATTDQGAVERMKTYAPILRRRTDDIESRGRLAGDSSLLYGSIKSLAEQNQVAVTNLRSKEDQAKVGKDRPFESTRVDMTVDGEFERIALFLDGLGRLEAYLRPVSVQLAPAKGETLTFTTMQLGMEVLRFKLPETLAEKEGGS